MKILIFISIGIAFVSCQNKILFQNQKITVLKSEYFGKFSNRDSNMYEFLRFKKWDLKFYSIEKRKSIYLVDSSTFGFSFLNDSILNINLNDTIYQRKIMYWCEFIDPKVDRNSILFNDYIFELLIGNNKSSCGNASVKYIDSNKLITDILVYHRDSNGKLKEKETQRYKLCFQAR